MANLKFKVDGKDLLANLEITPWEAALGARINIKSIDESVEVCIPSGTDSGERIRLPAKGFKGKDGSRGDLITTIRIVVPKKLQAKEKELFTQLKETSKFDPRKA